MASTPEFKDQRGKTISNAEFLAFWCFPQSIQRTSIFWILGKMSLRSLRPIRHSVSKHLGACRPPALLSGRQWQAEV